MLHHIYISLGSNLGQRLDHLQDAINSIHKEIGTIQKISAVYESPAWGFESDDFLNCCLYVTSTLEAHTVLDTLLQIETSIGRIRTNEEGYAARSIDLDILFFDTETFDDEKLKVPHPALEKRKFVLKPLEDIAPDYVHPKFNTTIKVLNEECTDESKIEAIKATLQNPMDSYQFANYKFIAIEGNIGSGKTSLSHMISDDFNAKLILERFAENAFLPKFYKEPARFAFPLEMSFLADRYQQLSDDIAQYDLFKEFVVADYHISKSLTFAKVTLAEDEFMLYRKFFNVIYKEMQQPELYLYLYQNTDRLLENIQKRGRDYEQDIKASYLEKINKGYVEFIKSQPQLNVKIIDVSEMDFVKNRTDYVKILDQIQDSITE